MSAQSDYVTPPTIAQRLGVSCDKVIGWILAGELRGCNLATRSAGRPRYRVSETDLADFLQRRSAAVRIEPLRPRRSRSAVKSFV